MLFVLTLTTWSGLVAGDEVILDLEHIAFINFGVYYGSYGPHFRSKLITSHQNLQKVISHNKELWKSGNQSDRFYYLHSFSSASGELVHIFSYPGVDGKIPSFYRRTNEEWKQIDGKEFRDGYHEMISELPTVKHEVLNLLDDSDNDKFSIIRNQPYGMESIIFIPSGNTVIDKILVGDEQIWQLDKDVECLEVCTFFKQAKPIFIQTFIMTKEGCEFRYFVETKAEDGTNRWVAKEEEEYFQDLMLYEIEVNMILYNKSTKNDGRNLTGETEAICHNTPEPNLDEQEHQEATKVSPSGKVTPEPPQDHTTQEDLSALPTEPSTDSSTMRHLGPHTTVEDPTSTPPATPTQQSPSPPPTSPTTKKPSAQPTLPSPSGGHYGRPFGELPEKHMVGMESQEIKPVTLRKLENIPEESTDYSESGGQDNGKSSEVCNVKYIPNIATKYPSSLEFGYGETADEGALWGQSQPSPGISSIPEYYTSSGSEPVESSAEDFITPYSEDGYYSLKSEQYGDQHAIAQPLDMGHASMEQPGSSPSFSIKDTESPFISAQDTMYIPSDYNRAQPLDESLSSDQESIVTIEEVADVHRDRQEPVPSVSYPIITDPEYELEEVIVETPGDLVWAEVDVQVVAENDVEESQEYAASSPKHYACSDILSTESMDAELEEVISTEPIQLSVPTISTCILDISSPDLVNIRTREESDNVMRFRRFYPGRSVRVTSVLENGAEIFALKPEERLKSCYEYTVKGHKPLLHLKVECNGNLHESENFYLKRGISGWEPLTQEEFDVFFETVIATDNLPGTEDNVTSLENGQDEQQEGAHGVSMDGDYGQQNVQDGTDDDYHNEDPTEEEYEEDEPPEGSQHNYHIDQYGEEVYPDEDQEDPPHDEYITADNMSPVSQAPEVIINSPRNDHNGRSEESLEITLDITRVDSNAVETRVTPIKNTMQSVYIPLPGYKIIKIVDGQRTLWSRTLENEYCVRASSYARDNKTECVQLFCLLPTGDHFYVNRNGKWERVNHKTYRTTLNAMKQVINPKLKPKNTDFALLSGTKLLTLVFVAIATHVIA